MDEAILKRLFKICGGRRSKPEVMPMTISWLGNSSVATVPTLLDLMLQGQAGGPRLGPGDMHRLGLGGRGHEHQRGRLPRAARGRLTADAGQSGSRGTRRTGSSGTTGARRARRRPPSHWPPKKAATKIGRVFQWKPSPSAKRTPIASGTGACTETNQGAESLRVPARQKPEWQVEQQDQRGGGPDHGARSAAVDGTIA